MKVIAVIPAFNEAERIGLEKKHKYIKVIGKNNQEKKLLGVESNHRRFCSA
jgi:hypothetical protein